MLSAFPVTKARQSETDQKLLQHSVLSSLCLLVYALAPISQDFSTFQNLSLIVPVLVVVWSLSSSRNREMLSPYSWLIVLVGLALALFANAMSAPVWLSGKTFVFMLSVCVLLKWMESSSLRELLFVQYASLVLLAIGSRYLNGVPALLYVLFGFVLFVVVSFFVSSRKTFRVRPVLQALKLLVLALPVSVILFFFFPRVQGPLTDLGIVIGLPISMAIDQDDRQKGLKATLKAGQVSRLKKVDAPVLVAEFEGTVPYKSRLYWRGPVFTYFDGESWQLPPNWGKRSTLMRQAFKSQGSLDAVLSEKMERVSYEARVPGEGTRFLYGLDAPTGRSAETFISGEFQLLSMRKLHTEFNYGMSAWLEYQGGRPLTEKEKLMYTQLPEGSNPRLVLWGKDLRGKAGRDDEAVLHALRVHYNRSGYSFSELSNIEASQNSLDHYFFEAKVGTIEHLAGATAVALRAAGMPARVVSGYRGGSLIALTNFVVVRQQHAHVWVETWVNNKGWLRFDAKDFVEPPEKNQRKANTKTASKPLKKSQKQSKPQADNASTKTNTAVSEKAKRKQSSGTSSSWLDSLGGGIETWIFNYSPEHQVKLMEKAGIERVNWKSLASLVFVALLMLVIIYALATGRKRMTKDTVESNFNKLSKAMAGKGYALKDNECSSVWVQRAQEAQEPFAPALALVVNQYLAIRYGRDQSLTETTPKEIKEFERNVKRLCAML